MSNDAGIYTYPPYPTDGIPLADRYLQTFEHRAHMLLPAAMRTPCDVRLIWGMPIVTLAGLITLGTITLSDSDLVVLTAQTDKRKNGPWLAKSSGWVRPDRSVPFAYRTLYRAGEGDQAGKMWIVRDPEPLVPDRSYVTIELYGTSRFDEYYRQAETDIWEDLNNGQHPILPHHVVSPVQLTKAKAYRTLYLLFAQSSENSVDGRPDRNERMAMRYEAMYKSELNMRNISIIGGARVHPISVRTVRG